MRLHRHTSCLHRQLLPSMCGSFRLIPYLSTQCSNDDCILASDFLNLKLNSPLGFAKTDQQLMILSGLVESISFNVSSLVPPSPIPANTTVESYTRKTRSQAMKKKHEKDTAPAADIMMLPPETE